MNLHVSRITSIDAFRGITILAMIFVNELAGVSGVPQWSLHMPADANTMTYVDVVFPAFLFIVGMSIPFALNQRLSRGDSTWSLLLHIMRRVFALVILGVFMVNAESGNHDSMVILIDLWSMMFYLGAMLVWKAYRRDSKWRFPLQGTGMLILIVMALIYRGGENGHEYLSPHWWGILGLIGWAYLPSSLLFLIFREKAVPVILVLLFCIIIYWIADSFPDWTMLAALKGHATHTGIVLTGMLMSRVLFSGSGTRYFYRLVYAGCLTVALFAGGFVLHTMFPISKIYATPTWGLISSGWCALLFMMLNFIMDEKGIVKWSVVLQPAAQNPLLAYIIPYIVFALMSLMDISFPGFFYVGWTGVLWCVTYAWLVIGLVSILNKRGFLLKV